MGTPLRFSQLSLEDIDELTYMLTLGVKAGPMKKSETSFATVMQGNWIKRKASTEHGELTKPLENKIEKEQSESNDDSDERLDEEEASDISFSEKMKCLQFTDVVTFAEVFVNEIIDVSVDVCEKLLEAAICGEEDMITEIPCICASFSSSEDSTTSSLEQSDSLVVQAGFSGWPTIKDFTVQRAKKKIMEYMEQWHFVEDWKYSVYYVTSYSDMVSDYHLFQAMWSIPTKEYPIPQATATVFFKIEVSRVKPKFCLVNVTIQFEGSRSVYRADQFEFMEQWLFNIVDSKLNLFKRLRF